MQMIRYSPGSSSFLHCAEGAEEEDDEDGHGYASASLREADPFLCGDHLRRALCGDVRLGCAPRARTREREREREGIIDIISRK